MLDKCLVQTVPLFPVSLRSSFRSFYLLASVVPSKYYWHHLVHPYAPTYCNVWCKTFFDRYKKIVTDFVTDVSCSLWLINCTYLQMLHECSFLNMVNDSVIITLHSTKARSTVYIGTGIVPEFNRNWVLYSNTSSVIRDWYETTL